ncbi:hypothetical protein FOA43_000170 [Brettanomyces nanus]|uniref:Uncharacterized protein n=1 Tax=Eeniella nana TaxID=13502 RepID=A0A875RWK6_EENNA|nr:uncharacterized protein FOA43_000170 [Brettanomyces nanus]QPG72868.1 hypothetical protein FOA43_000170 [Brettanomyces nanus]
MTTTETPETTDDCPESKSSETPETTDDCPETKTTVFTSEGTLCTTGYKVVTTTANNTTIATTTLCPLPTKHITPNETVVTPTIVPSYPVTANSSLPAPTQSIVPPVPSIPSVPIFEGAANMHHLPIGIAVGAALLSCLV